jgi:hypothetical protein
LRRQSPDSAFVFATECGGPFTPDAINRLIKRIGERARFVESQSTRRFLKFQATSPSPTEHLVLL